MKKLNKKELVIKRIQHRHGEQKFLIKNNEPTPVIKNNVSEMNERDKKRIYGDTSKPLPYIEPHTSDLNLRVERKIANYRGTTTNIIENNKSNLKKLTLNYDKYIGNMVGVLIVNLNNLILTKNCIKTLDNQINKNFRIYLFDQNSIEEGTSEYLTECENNGIIVYRNTENVPLNYLWNNFKNICNCEYLCFLNNDVELSNNFIDDTIKILDNEPKVGAVVHVTNNLNYTEVKNNVEYLIFDTPRYQGWDYTIKRDLMPEIPKDLKIFGGDDYIFAKLFTNGYTTAMAFSSPIIHYKERTRVNVTNIREIQRSDGNVFRNLIFNENLRQAYSTLDDGLCVKYPEPNMKLKQNKNCVYTAIIGDYDGILTPKYISNDWDYICFTDNINIKSDFWRIIYVENNNVGYLENVKYARYFKTNFYKYLSSYENVMWIDARITIIRDLNEYLKLLDELDIVFLKHPDASNIMEEYNRLLRGNIETPEMVEIIKKRYSEVNYKYDNGLISSGVMLFKNNEKTIKFFTEWWYEIKNFSHRDQLSGNFVMWKNPEMKYVMMAGMIKKYFEQLKRNTKPFRYE